MVTFYRIPEVEEHLEDLWDNICDETSKSHGDEVDENEDEAI